MKIWRNKPIEAGVFRGSAVGIAVTVHLPPIISVFEAAVFIAQLAASRLMQNDSYFMSSITLVVGQQTRLLVISASSYISSTFEHKI